MSQQSVSDTDLLPVSDFLDRTCGTNIDTEGVHFTEERLNLVFIDKVFSFNRDTASPILFELNTGGANTANFTVELTLGDGPIPCILLPNAVFEIDNSYVSVKYFNTRPPGNISASQVTLNGFPVDSVTFSNGQYAAVTENVLTSVQNERCLERGRPSRAFFLITNAGPWDMRAVYVLEGTVYTGGRSCRFRAVISNVPNSPNTMLPDGSLSSFAVRDLSLPCAVNGVSPTIFFQFNAQVTLVNPSLVVSCDTSGLPGSCTVSLVSNVAVDPIVQVESVRRTLFRIDAREGVQPCMGAIPEEENITTNEFDRRDNPVAGTHARARNQLSSNGCSW